MIRLAVRVPRESAELVLAELVGLAPGGVEEVDCGAGLVEYAIYGAEGEIPALPELQAAAGGVPVEVSSSRVADDWDERWKEFHRPVAVEGRGRRLLIAPPWQAGGGREDVVIDPGRAFGTGAHPTTRLCLELLLALEPAGSCIDLGCGSGVLAICAARLGWVPVDALDFDPASVEATEANAQANGAGVDVFRFDLLRDGPAPGASLVLANLLRPLLLAVAREGLDGEQPTALIAGGLLEREAEEASAALGAAFGLEEADRRVEDGWAAVLLSVS